MPELNIQVFGATRENVKNALIDLQELFDLYTEQTIDEGHWASTSREGEFQILQNEDEPKNWVGELVYNLSITRNLQS